MGNFNLRKHIRGIINEIFGGESIYVPGPNKFPYLDGTDAKTPSDLSAEFESELAPLPSEIGEFRESEEKERSIKVPTFDGKKKCSTLYKIPNKH